jgi:hypothetical protein
MSGSGMAGTPRGYGHGWEQVTPANGNADYKPSSDQYRLPESVFGKETPTYMGSQNADYAVAKPLGVGETYATPTFEQAGEYYAGSEHSTDVPVGKERAEDHNQGGLGGVTGGAPKMRFISYPGH